MYAKFVQTNLTRSGVFFRGRGGVGGGGGGCVEDVKPRVKIAYAKFVKTNLSRSGFFVFFWGGGWGGGGVWLGRECICPAQDAQTTKEITPSIEPRSTKAASVLLTKQTGVPSRYNTVWVVNRGVVSLSSARQEWQEASVHFIGWIGLTGTRLLETCLRAV